jgi:acyl-CoA hydrolase
MPIRKPADSVTIMTELVQANDANNLGNLHGGKLMYWMDICSAISATKHSHSIVVTASVDSVSFKAPIKVGDVVTIKAVVSRTFRTSMEIFIEVWAENMLEGVKFKSNQAYYTFVALDRYGKPASVDELIPETDEEKELYESAGHRRELRLIMSGRLKIKDSTALKALFEKKD